MKALGWPRERFGVNGYGAVHDGIVHEPEPVDVHVQESRGGAAEAGEHGDDAGQEALGGECVGFENGPSELEDVDQGSALERGAACNGEEAGTIRDAGLS